MLCAIYKSSKKSDTYLYVLKRQDFSAVPEPLMQTFGKPIYSMMLNLAKHSKLALSDIDKVKQQLTEKGFYLQLPPPTENLLSTLRQSQDQKRT
ncbi:YcgL domain-containing protein [Alteromonadaceae bacterium BrNp21-10]|nr:YcgL domain-containing protein [Alteromonadaceae bacterium BrNp21-10]